MKSWILTHYTRIIKAFIITVVLIAVVFGFMRFWTMLLNHHDKTLSEWPTMSGTIISTERTTSGDFDDEYPTLTVRFSYMVQGVLYQDSQELYAHDDYREESQYPLGSSITVYYNPVKPVNALINLNKYVPWWAPLPVYLFIIALIGCIYIWGWWIRGK